MLCRVLSRYVKKFHFSRLMDLTKSLKQMTYNHRLALLFFLASNTILALTATIYISTRHSLSAHFDGAYALVLSQNHESFDYDRGAFDWETWNCETKHLLGFSDDNMRKTCGVEIGARWLSLVDFVLDLVLCGFVLVDARGRRFLMRVGEEWRQ